MGSLIQPNQIIQTNLLQSSNTFDDLLTEIVKGNVVLVLGHEGILKDSLKKGNVKDVMFEHFIRYMRSKDKEFKVSCASFDDYFYKIRPNLSELKDDMVNALNLFDFNSIDDYSPLLFELLNRKYFKLVLTTTYDYYIEKMLEHVWGKPPRVISIYDAKNDIEKDEIGQLEMEPTLYYIFGKAEEKKDYVLIENDAFKVTEKWFSNNKPHNFLTYLSNKTILALGTKFDDWLFRFFWFILHRDIGVLKRGKVAISLNPQNSESDKRLCNYLDNEKIRHRNIEQAIKGILDGYPIAEKKYLEEHGRRGNDIFISYHSADYETVKHFFCSLDDYINKEKLRTHIWFDKNPDLLHGLKPGDDYRDDIKNAIQNCKVFIPVITKKVKDILEEGRKDYRFFIDEEWQSAIARKNLHDNINPIYIIPLCLDALEVKTIKPPKRFKEIFNQLINDSVGTNKTQIEYLNFLATVKNKFE